MSDQVYPSQLSVVHTNSRALGTPGAIRNDESGNKYRLVYLAASASYGHVVQFNTATASFGWAVVIASDSNIPPVGVLNQWDTSKSYTSGYYAWAQCKGSGIASCVASDYGAGVWMCASTNGALQSWHVTNVDHEISAAVAIASFQTILSSLQNVFINME